MANLEFDLGTMEKWLTWTPGLATNARVLVDWYNSTIRVPWNKVPMQSTESLQVAQMAFLMRLVNGKKDRLKILIRGAAACPELCRVRFSLGQIINQWSRIKKRQSELIDLYSKPMINSSLVEDVAASVERDKRRKQLANYERWRTLQEKMGRGRR